MSTARQGEQPYAYVVETLGLTEAEFEHAQRDPVTLAILGRVALEKIRTDKTLEMEAARARALEKRAVKAETDSVTGLLCRGPFLDAVRELKPAEAYLAVIMDLRGLKAVNDWGDHQAGDMLLAGAARTLVQKGLRSDSVVGRWGGDEFAMAVPIDETGDSEVVMQRLYGLFDGSETAETCDIGDDAVYLSARFGYSTVDGRGANAIEHALRQADIRMQELARTETTRGVMPTFVQKQD